MLCGGEQAAWTEKELQGQILECVLDRTQGVHTAPYRLLHQQNSHSVSFLNNEQPSQSLKVYF